MAKLTFFLDARHVSVKTGEAPLKIALSHRSHSCYIGLDVSVKPINWDCKKLKICGHPNQKSLNDKIYAKFHELSSILHKLDESCDLNVYNEKELRSLLLEEINPAKHKKRKNLVSVGFENFMEIKSGRTKDIYNCTWKKINAFMGKDAEILTFEQINIDWLYRFDKFLKKSAPSQNARSIHMRNLRAVFNYAIDNEVTTYYPFRRFKIKYEATKKRNFDVETIRAIFNMDNLEDWEVKYRDLFKLTFMLIGINFVDLCNLHSIHNGRIEYIRAKTRKPYSIKIEPEIAELIENYKGKDRLLNYLDTYVNYRHFYNNTCKGLQSIKEKLKEQEYKIENLTTYWARHSWATIAASLDIPKETIAAALGHSSHSVTDIYIEFDRRKVDEANRRVLNYVLYGYENGIAPTN